MRKLLLLSAGAVLLAAAGCANPRADQAAAAQQSLIGMPKAILLQCAGAPTHEANADGLDVLTYESSRLRADRTPMVTGGWGWGWGGWRGGPAFVEGGGTESRSCRSTFTVKDGRVAKLVYGSADTDGESRYDQCYSVVENCITASAGPPPR